MPITQNHILLFRQTSKVRQTFTVSQASQAITFQAFIHKALISTMAVPSMVVGLFYPLKHLIARSHCVLYLPMILFMLSSTHAHAQTTNISEQQKLAAVMAAVTYLLSEEEKISLVVNDFDPSIRLVSQALSVEVGAQSQDVDFCFQLVSSSATPSDSFTFTINGQSQTGNNAPVLGENCYVIPVSQQSGLNTVDFSVESGATIVVSNLGVEPRSQNYLGLPSLTRSSWDERAVRKVLSVFAFGGQATSQQIATWGDMQPRIAISEMLNFDQHNLKLSPLSPGERYTEPASQHGTMAEFYEHIESENSDIPIPVSDREFLGVDGFRFSETFGRMVIMRGLNPFRQRIGFFETNYHLATSRSANVERRQMVRYYDDIMAAHEQRVPYHEVMGVAAKSAAVAMQYGHRRNNCRNSFINNEGQCQERRSVDQSFCEFEGNADFAREIHQLFFGIFGINDSTHEDVTIENSARMLTGMEVEFIDDFGFDTQVRFNSCEHHQDRFGPLRILGHDITGVDAAEKIDRLMPISIQHEESLANLPVYIISTLADDNLTETKRNQLRAAWAQLGQDKDFLTFVHAYAISNLFHADDHLKYFSSFERAYYQANKFNIDNIEAYLSNDNNDGRAGKGFEDVIEGDNAGEAFRPLNNVFGGQTSLEASDSALAFELNYNRSATEESFQFRRERPSNCEACDQGAAWLKDWSKVIPQIGGAHKAGDVASWLWVHVVGNLDNYTELERSQLVSMLGAVRQPPVGEQEPNFQLDDDYTYFDLNWLLCIRADRVDQGINNNSAADLMSYDGWNGFCRTNGGGYTALEVDAFNTQFSSNDLANNSNDPFPYLRGLVDELAEVDVGLTETDPIERRRANERVQAALAFIFATPFVFAEGN